MLVKLYLNHLYRIHKKNCSLINFSCCCGGYRPLNFPCDSPCEESLLLLTSSVFLLLFAVCGLDLGCLSFDEPEACFFVVQILHRQEIDSHEEVNKTSNAIHSHHKCKNLFRESNTEKPVEETDSHD